MAPTLYGLDDEDMLLAAPELDDDGIDPAIKRAQQQPPPPQAPQRQQPALLPPNPLMELMQNVTMPTAASVGAGPPLLQRNNVTAVPPPAGPAVPVAEQPGNEDLRRLREPLPLRPHSDPTAYGPRPLTGFPALLGIAEDVQQAIAESPPGRAWRAVSEPAAGAATLGQKLLAAAETGDPAIFDRLKARGVAPGAGADVALQEAQRQYEEEPLPFFTGAVQEVLNPLSYLGPAEVTGAGRALRGALRGAAQEAIERAPGVLEDAATALRTGRRVGAGALTPEGADGLARLEQSEAQRMKAIAGASNEAYQQVKAAGGSEAEARAAQRTAVLDWYRQNTPPEPSAAPSLSAPPSEAPTVFRLPADAATGSPDAPAPTTAGASAPPAPPPSGPRPTGPSEGAPLFRDATERLLASAKDAGIDESLAQYAAQEIARPTPEQHPALKAWNTVYRVITPSAAQNPVVHQAEIAASRYADAQQSRIMETATALTRAIDEAFGTTSADVLPQLKARFRGDAGRTGIGDGSAEIGTIRHALEHPDLYSLSPQQRRAADEWRALLDKDMQQTRSALGAGDDSEAVAALWQQGTAPQTTRDLAEYLSVRLGGSAAARTEAVFLKELAGKVGGKRLPPSGIVQQGYESIVTQSGRAWQFPQAVAGDVRKALAGPQLAADDSALVRAVDEIKGLLLNLDGSVAFGRQGLLSFTADPIGTLRDWGQAAVITGTKEGKAQWLSQNADRLRFWSQRGLQMNVTPTDVARPLAGGKQTRPLVDRVAPGLGRLNEAQYGVVMPLLKMHRADTMLASLQAMRDGTGIYRLFEVVKDIPIFGRAMRQIGGADRLKGMTDDQLAEIAADAVNNWLGGADWAKIGQRGAVPRIGLLTEGWLRGQVNTLKNAATFGTPEGLLARRLVLSDLAAWAALATAGSLAASGKLPDYDPRSSNFLAIVTPSGYIQPPQATLYRTAARLFSVGVLEPAAQAAGRKLPDVKQPPDNAASRWMEGKLGTLPRVLIDLHTGQDFLGRPIDDKALYFARAIAPISVQTIADDVQSGAWQTEPEHALVRAGLSLAGLTVRPPSAEERQMGLRERVPGLTDYDRVPEAVAHYLAQAVGDPALASVLAEYARTDDRTVEGRRKRLAIEQSMADPSLLEELERAMMQVRERMVRENPDLLRYLQQERLSWRGYETPTPTPTPTPTATPTPLGQPTATPAGATPTRTPDPERTPRPGATPLVGAAKDVWAHRASQVWGRSNPDGSPLSYNQMSAAERGIIDRHLDRLNMIAAERYGAGKQWRGLTPAQQAVVEQEAAARYGPLAGRKPEPPPPTPTKTPFVPYRRPTATPGPDYFTEIYGGTATPTRAAR